MKAESDFKWTHFKAIKWAEAFLYWVVPTICFLAFVVAECAAIYWFFKLAHVI
ncbi:MAG: hypothetical protein JWM04_1248 [Verrucomicrobiales bacterium]|nr:hypothetical protein [Verrucomicrobiales bacterium]